MGVHANADGLSLGHHLKHFVLEKYALHRAPLAPGNASRMPESHPRNGPGPRVCFLESRRVEGPGSVGEGSGAPRLASCSRRFLSAPAIAGGKGRTNAVSVRAASKASCFKCFSMGKR